MKYVLVTNAMMTQFTGSELDTVAVAQYFYNAGWDVTIFTLEMDSPLAQEIDPGIHVNICQKDSLRKHYDLIWAHHYPLLDYLLFACGISADCVHYVSLSPSMPIEAPPFYYKDLNRVSVVCEKTKETLAGEGIDPDFIHVFPNYAGRELFSYALRFSELSRIAVVSNHVPEEVDGFAQLFEKRTGGRVDFYGSGRIYTRITPEILAQYDLIITIGRTVNDATAMGIPVYVYDHWGGYGYLVPENIESSFRNHFSARDGFPRRRPEELFSDITEGWKNCVAALSQVRTFAKQNYCFEDLMEITVNELFQTEAFDAVRLREKYRPFIRPSALYAESILKRGCGLTAQIFFDSGKGFSEEESVVLPYRPVGEGRYTLCVELPPALRGIRFDYTDRVFMKLIMIRVNGREQADLTPVCCRQMDDGTWLSVTGDPSVRLDAFCGVRSLLIEVSMEQMAADEVMAMRDRKERELSGEIQALESRRLKNRIRRLLKT